MSVKEKLIKRFLSKPRDFTFEELVTLLGYYDYYLDNKGKTSGSKAMFYNKHNHEPIRIHKPHNRKILLPYQVLDVYKSLKKENLL